MLRAIIIDDEQRGRSVLQQMLERFCPGVTVVASADGVETGIAAIREHRPDLVFLDVEMPPSTGFELLENLGRTDFRVVFVTAHDHHAIRAIRFSALDYLLKPVAIDDLKGAVARAEQSRPEDAGNEQMSVLFQSLRNVHGRVGLPTKDGLFFVSVSEITRCEADSNYTKIYSRDGKRYIAAKTLREYEQLFVEFDFVRVHHSHLVNIAHITQYVRGDGGWVVLTDGSRIEVSRRHKPDLMAKMTRL